MLNSEGVCAHGRATRAAAARAVAGPFDYESKVRWDSKAAMETRLSTRACGGG